MQNTLLYKKIVDYTDVSVNLHINLVTFKIIILEIYKGR